ncbi:hypothetical protein OCU04_005894 [Sclerotinia nivalis]|uniref:Uncharacterized protein n=1 Tax=Sclerotinia nivalis TaxID=352851 RepID=A0A9X0ALV3_9HELO|nr:hypothetical protein OCU04_005894 [Sclerotinia nivalis]
MKFTNIHSISGCYQHAISNQPVSSSFSGHQMLLLTVTSYLHSSPMKKFEDWRAKNIIVWSTFKFDVRKGEEKAWMPKQMIEKIIDEKWECGLLRRDLWEIVGGILESSSACVGDVMKMGKKWGGWER